MANIQVTQTSIQSCLQLIHGRQLIFEHPIPIMLPILMKAIHVAQSLI